MRVFRIDVGNGSFREVPAPNAGAPGALVWVDLDLTDIVDAGRFGQLGAIGLDACPPVYFELVARGHAPDDAGFRRDDFLHWNEAQGLRVNALGGPRMMRADAIGVTTEPGIVGNVDLTTSPVTMLSGPSWLLTTRGPVAPVPLDELRNATLSQWRSNYRSGSDLGVLILSALSETYLPALARIRSRLQAIEQAFVEGHEAPQDVRTLDAAGYRALLLDLKWAVDTLSLALPPLLRPGEPAQQAWFDAPGAVEPAGVFASRLEVACADIADLRQAISGAFVFSASADSAAQLEKAAETLELTRAIQESENRRAIAAEETEKRARAVQDALTLVAALFLGPGLVAAVYGALPGIFSGCEEARAISMIALMVLFALATLGYLRYRVRVRDSVAS